MKFETFADWASIFIVVELGIIAISLVPWILSGAFGRWVDWKTYRTATRLDVLADRIDGPVLHVDDNVVVPGNILQYTAIFASHDGVMIWRHLSDVTFVPIGDMGLQPIDNPVVMPRDGYARCRFVVTKSGTNASVVAYSGPIHARVSLEQP